MRLPSMKVTTFLAVILAPIAAASAEPVRAVATIGMIGDVVENVGGECVEVRTIMGPGVDPHLYQARASDVRAFQQADVIFYAGYSLEGQLGNVLARLSETRPTVAVSPTAAKPDDLIEADEDAYEIDPHLWMDVRLWARTVPAITGALSDLRPECADTIESNAGQYVSKLEALHEWVAEAVASIPEEQRILVTAHDAFNYYGRAYGIEVAGIQGISTESEAGVADVREMARIVADREVPAVFVETTISPRTVEAVTEAARRRGHDVILGNELYSDAMGEAGTAAGTYIGMIRENTISIVTALGGEVPTLPEALAPWAEKWEVAAKE